MTTYETKITRDAYRDLVAETVLPVFGERILRITTSKRSSGMLVTTATSMVRTYENGFVVDQWIPFEDFNKTLASVRIARVTEKAIKTAHESALVNADSALAAAVAFYQQQKAA